MPRIDNVTRLNADDFPDEDRETIERLAIPYNFFVEQVTNVLNGGVDFENLDRNLIQVQLQVNNGGVPVNAARFNAQVGLQGTNVIRVDNLLNPSGFPTAAPFLNFTTSGNGIYTINSITGLSAGTYRVILELIF